MLEEFFKHSGFAPPGKAFINSIPVTVFSGQQSPLSTAAENPKHTASRKRRQSRPAPRRISGAQDFNTGRIFCHSESVNLTFISKNTLTDLCQHNLDSNLSKARDLVYLVGNNNKKVFALDHYRARMLDFLLYNKMEEIIQRELGGGITDISFYLLEDGTGENNEGPIELEKRTK